MEKQLGVLLYLATLHGSTKDYRVKERSLIEFVLNYCKDCRKGLSEDDILNKGLDIYDDKDICVNDLIAHAIKEGYMDSFIGVRKDTWITVTEKGLDFIKRYLSDNYSDNFMAYQNMLNIGIKSAHKLPLDQLQIMRLFWRNVGVDEAIQLYLEPNVVDKFVKGYTDFLLKDCMNIDMENKVIFNLVPRLFVPSELRDRKVTLKIEGIDAPANMILNSPYPNKHFYVAGLRLGRAYSSSGLYPIIKPKDEFPENLKLKLIWEIEDVLTVVHNLDLCFKFTAEEGNMFSTHQHFNICCALDSFDLTTYVENEQEFYKGRDYEYSMDIRKKVLTISEKASLSNAPAEYFSNYLFDSHHSNWVRKQRETNKTNTDIA